MGSCISARSSAERLRRTPAPSGDLPCEPPDIASESAVNRMAARNSGAPTHDSVAVARQAVLRDRRSDSLPARICCSAKARRAVPERGRCKPMEPMEQVESGVSHRFVAMLQSAVRVIPRADATREMFRSALQFGMAGVPRSRAGRSHVRASAEICGRRPPAFYFPDASAKLAALAPCASPSADARANDTPRRPLPARYSPG